jgi:NADP-dependent 3-hydroxy acid dehydrogenase YdfG
MLSFSRKTAVITGASQGIGQAIAAALYEAGCSLVLLGREQQRLHATVARFQPGHSPSPQLIEADLLKPDDLVVVADKITASFPRVDILVNCGGAYMRGPWDEASPDNFDDLLKTNIIGPYSLTRLLLPRLVDARGDVVFINSSITRSQGLYTGQYKASQHALQAIADSLRAEYNEKGVRVLSIYPGRTATPRQEYIFGDEGRDYDPQNLLQPAEVANILLGCLSLPETAEVTDLYIRPRFKN